MKTINYKIEFFSNWHCGSGLAAGADVDELVVKENDGLPFVPGKTIKGLLREAYENVCAYKHLSSNTDAIFGYFDDANKMGKGKVFFSNAILKDEESKKIVACGFIPFLYQSFSSTAIDDNGIAKNRSLRKIETCVPCSLYGTIDNIPDEFVEENIKDAMRFIKRLGVGRNRGYGRCKISIVNEYGKN